ncbi:MAG: protein-L-isoaspartate(D-aspartate) O-methyltransferase [Leptospiraceae bacterium]|nr:protein-L-isoaspartate(D-aspartate) O-methyltransferase [Leptospiraceae bacterium]
MTDPYYKEREKMIKYQMEWRGIKDARVLEAIRKVPRHVFIPSSHSSLSYQDSPVPIGFGQTISQPYMVAYMTELLNLQGIEKVLEIGTGCGYQTAILAELSKVVFSIEIVKELCEISKKNLEILNYKNIGLRCGDGYFGWKEESPFDVILVTAAPKKIPEALKEQLKIGGILVIPVGKEEQYLYVYKKTKAGFLEENKFRVVFVPMTGKIQD